MEFSILKKCSILPGKYSLFRDSQHLTHHPEHPRFTRPELQAPHQPKIWKVKHRSPRTRPRLQPMFFLTSRCHAKLVAKYFKINPLTAFICPCLLHVSIHGSAISPFTLTETPAPPGQRVLPVLPAAAPALTAVAPINVHWVTVSGTWSSTERPERLGERRGITSYGTHSEVKVASETLWPLNV